MRPPKELDGGGLASEFNAGEPASLVARLVLAGKVRKLESSPKLFVLGKY
jgi:hypothetical protein